MMPEIVAIGASRGSFETLKTILRSFPADFQIPVVVVQHGIEECRSFISHLSEFEFSLPLVEIYDKMPIVAGYIFLAPGDYHLMIDNRSFILATEDPCEISRPSIDLFFLTLAEAFGERSIGVILSGGGSDGALGLAAINDTGGVAIVQDPDGAESSILPGAAITMACPEYVLHPEEIGPRIIALCTADVQHQMSHSENHTSTGTEGPEPSSILSGTPDQKVCGDSLENDEQSLPSEQPRTIMPENLTGYDDQLLMSDQPPPSTDDISQNEEKSGTDDKVCLQDNPDSTGDHE